MSCFFCSSDVGRPIDFCLWSYIIFSTIPRVSPSRSDSCPAGKTHSEDGAGSCTADIQQAEYIKRLKLSIFYLWVLGTDFLGVNFWISGNNLAPPLHFIYLKLKKVIRLSSSFIYFITVLTSYLFKVDCNNLAVVDEPGAFLYLHFIVKLAFNDGRVSLQADLEWASLDVHHYISPLNAKVDIKRHCKLCVWGW